MPYHPGDCGTESDGMTGSESQKSEVRSHWNSKKFCNQDTEKIGGLTAGPLNETDLSSVGEGGPSA